MTAATGAMIFRARPDQSEIGPRAEGAGSRVPEARPAGAAVELVDRFEKRQGTGGADVGSAAILVVEGAAERTLGVALEQYAVALGRQKDFPFRLGLHQGCHGSTL